MTSRKSLQRLDKTKIKRERAPGVVVCGAQDSANVNHTKPLTNFCGQIT